MNNKNFTYIEFLDHIPPFYKEMTLDGIKALLHQLGDFHQELKVIHIAGTNGKGSCVKMLSSIYAQAGYKVGTFTSPYINDYRECIEINNTIIDKALMNSVTHKVAEAYQQLVLQHLPLPTHYECITVISLLAMSLEKVDLAIIEVLMGGLHDATNVFSSPLLSIITSISLDHTTYLGNTVELIAAQKSGIIKAKCPVILNLNKPSIQSVVSNIARELSAPLHLSEDYVATHYCQTDSTLYYKHLILKGTHQIDNLKGVLTAIDLLKGTYRVEPNHIIKGLETVHHPCRLESINHHSLNFIIDGSHNDEGILALTQYLKTQHGSKHLVFILGMLQDKDQEMIKHHIYSIADQVILTTPSNPRKYDLEAFYQCLPPLQKDITLRVPAITDAYTYVIEQYEYSKDTLFIACGSLYISFPFRQLLLET